MSSVRDVLANLLGDEEATSSPSSTPSYARRPRKPIPRAKLELELSRKLARRPDSDDIHLALGTEDY